jgi:Uma2 family endonuclease
MVASFLTVREDSPASAELLHPEPLPGGIQPEERVVLCGLGWDRHLALDTALGDDRPGPRFYYLDGDLEIMTTSNEHERIKKWIADMMVFFFAEQDIEIVPRGQATMRDVLRKAGAEPDESWCLHEEKTYPDIVLEIALTSGGLNKLEIYRRFSVPEVWIWRRQRLEIHALRADGSGYDLLTSSRQLPELPLELLVRCAAIPSWRDARLAFCEGIQKKG